MVMTKRGVYHNLQESEYATSNGEVAFFFSSKFYLNKFLDEYKTERENFNKKIAKAMHIHEFDLSMLSDIHFYKEVEKRGFRATERGIDVQWQELHLYALAQMIERNTRDWYEIQGQK